MIAVTDMSDYDHPITPSVGTQQSMPGRAQNRSPIAGPLGFGVPGVKPRYRVAAPAREAEDGR